jgi:hypothetical protein
VKANKKQYTKVQLPRLKRACNKGTRTVLRAKATVQHPTVDPHATISDSSPRERVLSFVFLDASRFVAG